MQFVHAVVEEGSAHPFSQFRFPNQKPNDASPPAERGFTQVTATGQYENCHDSSPAKKKFS
jgi:hypothetical protein